MAENRRHQPSPAPLLPLPVLPPLPLLPLLPGLRCGLLLPDQHFKQA